MTVDILNMEWSSSGRDVEAVEPVLSYLEHEYGLGVCRESILNAAWKLVKYRPGMFLIGDSAGAAINSRTVKLAYLLGIQVVTLEAEGDYGNTPILTDNQFWGWNEERVFYENLHLEWSESAIQIIRTRVPNADELPMVASGATGFDKYQLLDFMTRDQLLSTLGVEGFDRVVGISGWSFDRVPAIIKRLEITDKTASDQYAWWVQHNNAREPLRSVYEHLIKSFPDTLFVLKHHPVVMDDSLTEFSGLDDYPNVRILRGVSLGVGDVISGCDLWLAYESTTCLEAWLLGKQTLLVNPQGRDFRRSVMAKGSPVVTSAHEAENALRQALEGGSGLPGFVNREGQRKDIVRRIIGWGDGRNHVRAAEHIVSVIETSPRRSPRFTPFVAARLLSGVVLAVVIRTGLLRALPAKGRFAQLKDFQERYDYGEREAWRARFADGLARFHGWTGQEPSSTD